MLAKSLPQPPDGSKLYVQLGNELNLAWGCACEADSVCMSMERIAAETAHYSRDGVAALQKVPNLAVAITAIAPMGESSRPCCSNATQCAAVAKDKADCQGDCWNVTTTFTSLSYDRLLVEAVPDLYKDVDWFSAHSYPCAGDGVSSQAIFQ